MFINDGDKDRIISSEELLAHLDDFIAEHANGIKRLLLLPPDHTRLNSRSGEITAYLYEQLKDQCEINIMPALGTHVPMTPAQLHLMFGKDIPLDAYMPHDWRNALKALGELSAGRIKELSEDKLNFPMQVAVNKEVFNNYDLNVSIPSDQASGDRETLVSKQIEPGKHWFRQDLEDETPTFEVTLP